jgi:AcrR family transcriptional regulator
MKVRTAARREAIVEAAAELFEEFGYERASMNELVKRLGGSKATLYGYFASKEELFSAVVRAHATAHLSEAVVELHAGVGSDVALEATLQRFGERMLLVLTNDQRALAVYRMVIAEAGRSELGQLFYASGPSESVAAVAKVLGAAMDRRELRKADARVSAHQFLALITAEIEVRVYQRDPPPLSLRRIRVLVKRAVEMFLLGAAPR